ncbi:protein IQ-DOMAIN 11 [Alnus glutinosa]|uniref:protein IQ-DOMAIN 11 n=1 Tax=Alnus glutinosa TaxID=3517 RepID=UPI002D79BE3E|nr:protein IQ-DOMAIN 11 [Alnus glutinosa]
MAKKKSWFNILKRFFIRETQLKPEKEKRRKWMFGRLKIKRLASLTAPSTLSLDEAEEEQSNHAPTVALATTAVAEEVLSADEHEKEEFSVIKVEADAPQSNREILEFAATKIQSAFRGYLARKALRALKGIVKLQAIIRGRAVRRQAITTLKCLQSIVNIQSQVCTRRFEMAEGDSKYDRSKELPTLRDKIITMDSNSQRRWVDSILSKEEAEALYLSKKEAMIKRERIKDYSFSHRKSAESERNKVNGRWRYWLDEWVDTQVTKSRELEDLDSVPTSNPRPGLTVEDFGRRQLKLRNIQVQKNFEGLDSPLSISRRSFHHRRQCSLGDHNSLSSSPFVPAYMAATASAKAKSRSMSSPKMRTSSFETCSESYSPCKNKLSLISPMTTEMPTRGRIGKTNGYQQRSPSLKGLAGPIKSGRTAKDLSFDSEYSMQIWHQNDGFR